VLQRLGNGFRSKERKKNYDGFLSTRTLCCGFFFQQAEQFVND
jgi:hypothetical protein